MRSKSKMHLRWFVLSSFVFLVGALSPFAAEPAPDVVFDSWAIIYTPKNDNDWSDGANRTWGDKQEYDYTLRRAGKIYLAGVFKPGGHPTEWMVLLQPMTKTEAQQIADHDPCVLHGFATAKITMLSRYLDAPKQ